MLASLCVILYSMMILECWRRCCSVGRSRCWSMVVTLACLLKLCMMCLAERRCTVSSLWILGGSMSGLEIHFFWVVATLLPPKKNEFLGLGSKLGSKTNFVVAKC